MTSAPSFPPRFAQLRRLGQGGGGEVWAAVDPGGAAVALKVLGEDASEPERAALVREAIALSGLEGLGAPRVLGFGRLGDGRAYLVRELVDGDSLEAHLEAATDPSLVLTALAGAADQLTVLHRAGLLHGDVKPANVVVGADGRVTLVDLGLAAPWREGGAPVSGLTPRYAAPELFDGRPLTVRAEVYALGVMLDEACERLAVDPALHRELEAVAARATREAPLERYPSADEFASALRRGAGLPAGSPAASSRLPWPVTGIDGAAESLRDQIERLGAGEVLAVVGPDGSGRTTLLRRVAWTLAIEGAAPLWVDGAVVGAGRLLERELEPGAPPDVVIVVDDASRLDADARSVVERARQRGARIVATGAEWLTPEVTFVVPPLPDEVARELVRRAAPALTERLARHLVTCVGARPGPLREALRSLGDEPVASERDIDAALGPAPSAAAADPGALAQVHAALERGRFSEARDALAGVRGADPLDRAVVEARVLVGLGDARAALAVLEAASPLAAAVEPPRSRAYRLALARACLGTGDYRRTTELAAEVAVEPDPLGLEAGAYEALARSFQGDHDRACAALRVLLARAGQVEGPRIEAVVRSCLGIALQRAERIDDALAAYEGAIAAAERAAEAGLLASARLNLAGLFKMRGEVARAIEHFEGAIEMGRRSGRLSTVRQAVLDLANTDLHLGRIGRARAGIEALAAVRAELSAGASAQLLGLEAELALALGQPEAAATRFAESARAWEAMGRRADAAEALLEAVLAAPRLPARAADLGGAVERARVLLGSEVGHRALLELAEARVAWLARDEPRARAALDRALSEARARGQRDWLWRALVDRAEIAAEAGQSLLARRDREDALAVVEAMAVELPRDLREVYWDAPGRRRLRQLVDAQLAAAPTEIGPGPLSRRPTRSSSLTGPAPTPLEQRLARLLEINADLAGVLDVDRLTAKVVDHAVELVRGDRGFVVLRAAGGALTVHAARERSGGDVHAEFSRSIAAAAIESGEPIVTLSARRDARMAEYASVHQLAIEGVACVPIRSPAGGAIGALYVERSASPAALEAELPTLRAFADQAAIALENARLVGENRARADALADANTELEAAQARLRELLGDRTEKLKAARRQLRETKGVLYGHFGYHGLVGTSAAMRRLYSIVDRVKDTDVPVLIRGESGTGKEVVARALHEASPRSRGRLLGINCGAIPEHLLESELFGHVRGAFTGADRERRGLLREATGGTVLLDEIGEMPQKMQAGLLRVLQERRVRAVGGTEEVPIDVRFVFATHRDLEAMVLDGRFREDLLYRIQVVELGVPPLRERADDIPQLVDHFLGLFASRHQRERKIVTRDAMRRLQEHPWPGNVRQLENVLLNAWVLAEADEIGPQDLDLPPADPRARAEPGGGPRVSGRPARAQAEPGGATPAAARRGTLSEHRREERARILAALESCAWNRFKAAELVGIPRRTFYRRLREYGIQ
ncbi:MAG: sigma 54-interacting transcriptional regulator [Polyangiaceae bacterium]|nr:sigma 54-interacting transcriptional regulator [Polyangiaceae bacterium]